MRKATVDLTVLVLILTAFSGWLLGVLEPQKEGVVGGIVYLIAQHELYKSTSSFIVAIPMVILMGYIGSWVAINVIFVEYYTNAPDGLVKFVSGIFGFFAYDTILLLAGNTKSIIRFGGTIAKDMVTKMSGRIK